MKRPPKKVEEGLAEWFGTYSDMVTLLLTFFIMLFSMSVVDQKKYEDLYQAMAAQFSGTISDKIVGKPVMPEDFEVPGGGPTATVSPTATPKLPTQAPPDVTDDLKKRMEQAIKDFGLEDKVFVIDEKTFLMLRIDSIVLFDSGSAEINQHGQDVLKRTGQMLKSLEKAITVQGHTDSRPINSLLFPTNWELSTKRATNVVLFLIDQCGLDPAQLTASGNGEFRPILPNDTEENREKNRRIDIVIDK